MSTVDPLAESPVDPAAAVEDAFREQAEPSAPGSQPAPAPGGRHAQRGPGGRYSPGVGVRRGPGRPKGSKTRVPSAAPVAPAAPPEEPVSPEAAMFWGTQFSSLWNQLAHARGWPSVPGAPVDEAGLPKPPDDPEVFIRAVGEPMARTMQRVFPLIDERPWLQVVVIMAPFIGGAVGVEVKRLSARGAARPSGEARPDGTSGRVGPGGLRPEGQRENLPGQSDYLGAAMPT